MAIFNSYVSLPEGNNQDGFGAQELDAQFFTTGVSISHRPTSQAGDTRCTSLDGPPKGTESYIFES